MTTTQQIDVTAPGDDLSVVEILTAAGIVRVNTNLIDTLMDQPVVVVEVEPNTSYRPKTKPGGDWDVEVRGVGLGVRTDVRLTKRKETAK